MATPFLSEIKIVSFGFAPKGWALCNGQLLPINQNQALFSLLGTTYGGDGRITFGLPNLQGRTPVGTSNGFTLGQLGGETAHTLLISEISTHVHTANASSQAGTDAIPTNNLLANTPALIYNGPAALTTLLPATVGTTGGSQAHNNMQPYLVLNFCIALQGIFPTQN
jgi:microcystin-dependent protein